MMVPKIDYVDHGMGANQMLDFFPGIRKNQLPGGVGWALEFINLTTHSGIDLDAPYHYHPTMDRGKPSMTIDEVPLEWCFSNGVLLDLRRKGDGERITVADVKKELAHIRYEIKPLDIVLIWTGADAVWGKPEYLTRGAGMDRESTLFFIETGVRRRDRCLELGSSSALSGPRIRRERGTPRSSGRPISPVSIWDIATWKRWPTSAQ